MRKYKNTKGISLLIVIGSYGSFHFTKSSSSLHLCLGFIAFTIFFYDVENAMAKILSEAPDEIRDVMDNKPEKKACEDCGCVLTGGYEVKCGKCWTKKSESEKPF